MKKCLVAPDSFKGPCPPRKSATKSKTRSPPRCLVAPWFRFRSPMAAKARSTASRALPESRAIHVEATGPFPGESVESAYLVVAHGF